MKCQATKRDGSPCTQDAQPGKAHCWGHDPDLAQARKQGNAAGGRHRSNAARARKALPSEPLTTTEVHAWLSMAFRRALVGKMDAPMLNALSTAAKALADLAKVVDFEDQLADMRRQITDLNERRRA